MGFFSYFRDYIPNFSALAKLLTDLMAKRVPHHIPWGQAVTRQRGLCAIGKKLVDICILSGEDVLMYSGSVCRYGRDVWRRPPHGQYPVPCLAH